MAQVTFCDNCNADEPLFRVRVIVGNDAAVYDLEPTYDKRLCAPCRDAVSKLDFKTLQDRHDKRPRERELP